MRAYPSCRLSGYSLIEVSIAIAIVAIGLVAIFGILPAGLNVQRDNRQETIIKYEAMYWMEALRSGGAALPILNRVDWIEVKRPTGIYTADYTMMGPQAEWSDPLYRGPITNRTQLAYMKDLKRSLWRTDLIGWLSAPDTNAESDFENGDAKRVRVRSFSGPIGKPLDYIMECQIVTDSARSRLCTIRLTFMWPVIERPWSQNTPWWRTNAWPLGLSAISGNYDFTEVGRGRKVYTTRASLPGPVPSDYPGLAVMSTNLSLSNAVVTGGRRRHYATSSGDVFGGYPYQVSGATPSVTNISNLPLALHFFGSEDTP